MKQITELCLLYQCPMVVVGSKADLQEERIQDAVYPESWATAHNGQQYCT